MPSAPGPSGTTPPAGSAVGTGESAGSAARGRSGPALSSSRRAGGEGGHQQERGEPRGGHGPIVTRPGGVCARACRNVTDAALFGAVTAAWGTIALLVFGLPLLAWWIGSRRIWSRVELRSGTDPAAAIFRRHGLTHAQSATVTSAVTWGRALDDPAERAAAADLARLTLDQLHPSWDRSSRGRRIVRLLGWLWLLTAASGLVFLAISGRLGDVNWGTATLAALAVGTPSSDVVSCGARSR